MPKKRKTKAERRVEVARDVLKLIKSERINAEAGTYFYTPYELDDLVVDGDMTLGEARDSEATLELPPCDVCAKGAVLYAMANGVKSTDRDHLPWQKARWLFGKDFETLEQLFESYVRVAEGALQNYTYNDISDRCYGPDVDYVQAFNDKYPDDEDKLKYLMRNIIRNKGKLVLPRKWSK